MGRLFLALLAFAAIVVALRAARGEELRALIDLYRALGGGWQVEP